MYKNTDFNLAKENMIKGQILPNKIINEELIEAFANIPRHEFVNDKTRNYVYSDANIDLGSSRQLLAPMTLAKMIQELSLDKKSHVLDIASGTGYSSAILANIAGSVVALESTPDLVTQTKILINKLNLLNVIVIESNIENGNTTNGPYDAILINGSANKIPNTLFDQLKENGKLVTIFNGTSSKPGMLTIYEKQNSNISSKIIFECNANLLPEFS